MAQFFGSLLSRSPGTQAARCPQQECTERFDLFSFHRVAVLPGTSDAGVLLEFVKGNLVFGTFRVSSIFVAACTMAGGPHMIVFDCRRVWMIGEICDCNTS